MTIICKCICPPGKDLGPTLHERLSNLRMTSYSSPIGNDICPLPCKTGDCFDNRDELIEADNLWKKNYQKLLIT